MVLVSCFAVLQFWSDFCFDAFPLPFACMVSLLVVTTPTARIHTRYGNDVLFLMYNDQDWCALAS